VPIACPKKERRGAAALYLPPNGHMTTSKSNEHVDDIHCGVAMSRNGGYVGYVTDAPVGGRRIASKLQRGFPRTHVESEPTRRTGREPPAVSLGGRAGLAVEPQQVVLGQAEAADGWFGF
jgi:hypothetical protein